MGRNRKSGDTIASRSSGAGSGAGGSGFGVVGSGAGGGTGTGAGSGDAEEMSQRIEERLQEARTVEVSVESRTRGEMERVQVHFEPDTPGQVQVTSASGNTYIVDSEEETCTCQDYRYRRSRCRHIEAAGIAQEQSAQGTSIGSSRAADINVNETLREHIAYETAEETINVQREFTDDEHFYSDNPEEFDRDMERLKDAPIPYEYENVLNGSDITFGIELEFVEGDSNAIARELYDLGICSSPRMEAYHGGINVPGKWKLEEDCSVTLYDRGGELISPVLQDTPETWRQIEIICEVARRHGGYVNWETGGHVHISAEPLDGKRQRWRRLFKAFKGTEEAIFRFSGGEQGRFRGTNYAESSVDELGEVLQTRLPEEGTLDDFRNALDSDNSGIYWEKFRSINLEPFTTGIRNAIEIRAFNGSLTPGVIQANVKVAAGLIHTAERSRIQGDEYASTTEASRKRGRLINEHTGNGMNKETMIRMVDTFFSRKSDKEHILSVMAKNDWW